MKKSKKRKQTHIISQFNIFNIWVRHNARGKKKRHVIQIKCGINFQSERLKYLLFGLELYLSILFIYVYELYNMIFFYSFIIIRVNFIFYLYIRIKEKKIG